MTLACIPFGAELLRTNDLDPLYAMLYCANLPRRTLGRFLLAYSMFYHAGVSARIAEARDFWEEVRTALRENWPRGTERRHFRGHLASSTVSEASRRYRAPEEMLDSWFTVPTFRSIFVTVQQDRGFGPWIAFKMADIAERTGYAPRVDFAGCDLSMYRDPKKGAALYRYGDENHDISAQSLALTVRELENAFSGFLAPPRYDRPINVQEVETVLCKWKSHTHGKYPLGKDTREILHGLHGWGDLATELSRCPLLF